MQYQVNYSIFEKRKNDRFNGLIINHINAFDTVENRISNQDPSKYVQEVVLPLEL